MYIITNIFTTKTMADQPVELSQYYPSIDELDRGLYYFMNYLQNDTQGTQPTDNSILKPLYCYLDNNMRQDIKQRISEYIVSRYPECTLRLDEFDYYVSNNNYHRLYLMMWLKYYH